MPLNEPPHENFLRTPLAKMTARAPIYKSQKMKPMKRGKRSDACLRRFHVVTAFDSDLPNSR